MKGTEVLQEEIIERERNARKRKIHPRYQILNRLNKQEIYLSATSIEDTVCYSKIIAFLEKDIETDK